MPEWTEQEKKYLKDNYGKISPVEIAEKLGRTPRAVINARYRMGFDAAQPRFTEEEIAMIRNHYKGAGKDSRSLDLDRLSKILGRTKQIICRKAGEMGLTTYNRKMTPEQVRSTGEKIKKYYIKHPEVRDLIAKKTSDHFKKNGHPKGMLGKKHTEKLKKEMSRRSREMWADPNHYLNSEEYREICSNRAMKNTHLLHGVKAFSRAKSGVRADLGFYVRSKWEANYARYLKFLKEKGEIYGFEYEPDTFIFEQIKKGTRSYMPDFKVWLTEEKSEYHEVKGWMDPKSKTKLSRMGKYYPEVKIIVIGPSEYKDLKQWARLIPNWED